MFIIKNTISQISKLCIQKIRLVWSVWLLTEMRANIVSDILNVIIFDSSYTYVSWIKFSPSHHNVDNLVSLKCGGRHTSETNLTNLSAASRPDPEWYDSIIAYF